MFIVNDDFEFFREFLKRLGCSELQEPKSSVQPDYRFSWRGKLFWIYSDGVGHEIQGEDLKSLNEIWERTVKRFEERQQNEENDG